MVSGLSFVRDLFARGMHTAAPFHEPAEATDEQDNAQQQHDGEEEELSPVASVHDERDAVDEGRDGQEQLRLIETAGLHDVCRRQRLRAGDVIGGSAVVVVRRGDHPYKVAPHSGRGIHRVVARTHFEATSLSLNIAPVLRE